MSLFSGPAEHAAHPPQTWTVVRRGPGAWAIEITPGVELTRFRTKREAENETRSGYWVRLYDKESRWYAGGTVPGWRPYAEVVS